MDTSSAQQPSPIAWGMLTTFHRVHRLCRGFRKARVYSDKNNWLHIAAGHTIGSLAPRAVAQGICIASRIVSCVKRKEAFCFCWQEFSRAVKGSYPLRHKVCWKEQSSIVLVSPSTLIWLKSNVKSVKARVTLIFFTTISLLKQTFLLSLALIEAGDAFLWDQETAADARNEIFVNGKKLIQSLRVSQDQIVDKLKQERPLIDFLLKRVGSGYSVDSLIQRIEVCLTPQTQLQRTAKKVSKKAGEVMIDLLRRGVFGFMVTMGLAQYTPGWLVPTLEPKWTEEKQKDYGRYPDEERLTREVIDWDWGDVTVKELEQTQLQGIYGSSRNSTQVHARRQGLGSRKITKGKVDDFDRPAKQTALSSLPLPQSQLLAEYLPSTTVDPRRNKNQEYDRLIKELHLGT